MSSSSTVISQSESLLSSTRTSLILEYGPYEVGGIIKHRTERLQNLIGILQTAGFPVILQETPHRNRVSIMVDSECIFRCNIIYLQYPNVPDKTAETAYQVVFNSMSRSSRKVMYNLARQKSKRLSRLSTYSITNRSSIRIDQVMSLF